MTALQDSVPLRTKKNKSIFQWYIPSPNHHSEMLHGTGISKTYIYQEFKPNVSMLIHGAHGVVRGVNQWIHLQPSWNLQKIYIYIWPNYFYLTNLDFPEIRGPIFLSKKLPFGGPGWFVRLLYFNLENGPNPISTVETSTRNAFFSWNFRGDEHLIQPVVNSQIQATIWGIYWVDIVKINY